jgi:hypothetical protein
VLSDVPVTQLKLLPRVSVQDKQEILGSKDAHPIPKAWKEDSVPLHWGEVKPTAYWEALIGITNAAVIIDTMGCAAAATAAFKQNVQYLAICSSVKHAHWLTNVVDRSIIRLLVSTQHPLYSQSLADLIDRHFHEELDLEQQKLEHDEDDLNLEDD